MDALDMITSPPNWSIMVDEAKLYLDLLDRALRGPMHPKDCEKFFGELPKTLEDGCAVLKQPGALQACRDAINILRNKSGSQLDYVDKELISRLRKVLQALANGDGIKEIILGNRILMKFTLEQTPDLSTADSLRGIMAAQAMVDIKAGQLVGQRAKWVTRT